MLAGVAEQGYQRGQGGDMMAKTKRSALNVVIRICRDDRERSAVQIVHQSSDAEPSGG